MTWSRIVGRFRIFGAAIPFAVLTGITFAACAAWGTYLKPNPWESSYAQLVIGGLAIATFYDAVCGLIRFAELGISGDDTRGELRDVRRRMLFKQLLASVGCAAPQALASASEGYWKLISLITLFYLLKVVAPSQFLDAVVVERIAYANKQDFLGKLGAKKSSNRMPLRKVSQRKVPRKRTR